MKNISRLIVAQPTKEQLLDYVKSLVVVNNYAYAITNQKLPSLNYASVNYANFVANFSPAKQHALNWSSNIFVEIVQLPKNIANQAADLFNLEKLYINASLKILIADPSNQAAKKELTDALSIASEIVKCQGVTVDCLSQHLSTFCLDIQNDAAVLSKIAADAFADAGSDKVLIDSINHSIEEIKSEIKTAEAILATSEIGLGACIFVGILGVTCCFIPGAQGIGAGLILVAVAGEAASITFTVLESKNIKKLQEKIKEDQKQITDLNQDIIQLRAISSQFNDLKAANINAQNSLKAISAMWSNLEAVLKEVKDELDKVNDEVTSEQYQQVLDIFQKAESNWNDVVDFARALAGINYSWQDKDRNWHIYGSGIGTKNPDIDSGNVDQISA